MIVITTMDLLPEHCFKCPCHDGESGYCQADASHRYSDYRPFWCPLKEIVNCHNCKHATMTSDGKMCKYCAMDTDDFGNQRDVYHDADWFCADGERQEER